MDTMAALKTLAERAGKLALNGAKDYLSAITAERPLQAWQIMELKTSVAASVREDLPGALEEARELLKAGNEYLANAAFDNSMVVAGIRGANLFAAKFLPRTEA